MRKVYEVREKGMWRDVDKVEQEEIYELKRRNERSQEEAKIEYD